MTRAALLPAGSDPFLLAYWLRNYATWADQVDELRIAVCGPLEPEVLDDMRARVAAVPHATMLHVPERMMHGDVIALLVAATDADTVMLCEDDGFIRHPAVVGECFARLDDGVGVVAGPRGFAADEIQKAAADLFGAEPDGLAFWPCFLFTQRASLVATDFMFGSRAWEIGETDPTLRHTFREWSKGDTFVSASFQLRAQGLAVELRDQYRLWQGRVVPDDAPWFHVGSLSAGHGFMFMGGMGAEKYAFEIDIYRRLPPGEAMKRIAWWERAWRCADGVLKDHHWRYGEALRALAADLGIFDTRPYWAAYPRIVTWAER